MTDPKPSSVAEPSNEAFPFSGAALPAHGPRTVINPEGRGSLPDPAGGPLVDDEVVGQLFPTESQVTSGELPDPRGVQFGHFSIQSLVAHGGMGAVFRAFDERLQRIVALKVLSPEQSRDPAAVERFRNEARAAARLDHDNVVRVFYEDEDHGLPYIVYEFVEGENLRDRIHEQGRLSITDAVNYALQLAHALHHTSSAGIVHRDIKPSNAIVTAEGQIKLVDLGLARNDQTVDDLTIAGTTLGTFDYISPEQAKDPRNVDVRSDVYSLGCTLYHMLTGDPPYPEGTVLQKLLDHHGKEPPDPAARNGRIPEGLSAICRKMMASDPNRRYATPDLLIRDLMLLASELGIHPVHPDGYVWTSSTERPRFWANNLGWIATVATLLLVVAVLDWFPEITQSVRSDGPSAAAGSSNAREESEPEHDRQAAGPGEVTRSESDSPSGQNGREQITPVPIQDVEDGSSPLDDPQVKPLTIDPKGDPEGEPVGPDEPFVPPVASSSDDETGTESEPPDVETAGTSEPAPRTETETPPAISIATNGSDEEPRSFPTLEAACAAAENGSVVELAFNGPREEKPLRVSRKTITIKAREGFRPVLVFRHESVPAEGDVVRMITVGRGAVDLIDLDLVLHVDPAVTLPAESGWSLFAVRGADQVRLQGVTVTVVNPGARVASVFDLLPRSSTAMMNTRMMKGGGEPTPQDAEIRMTKSFVRGAADVFHVRHTGPARFDVDNSAVAVEGSLLTVRGGEDAPAENVDLELQMEHVTAVTGNGLLRIDTGDVPRFAPPVRVSARNNILATDTDVPLVAMTGATDKEDLRSLLRWNGVKNFYDRYQTFWTLASTQSTSDFETLDFDAWQQFWEPTAATRDGVVWLVDWRGETFDEFRKTRLALDLTADVNPAASGASDGSHAGARLEELPEGPDVVTEPLPEAAD